MPSSVNKVLMHGAAIIESFGLTLIGQLPIAAEARNKDFRKYCQHHPRKGSRKTTNEDILNNLLVSSDSLISTKRHKFRRKKNLVTRSTNKKIEQTETFDDDQENVALANTDCLDTDSIKPAFFFFYYVFVRS